MVIAQFKYLPFSVAFVPAPPVPQPPSVVPAPPIHPPPPREDEPVSKKMKSEDNLIPEEEFLRRNKVCLDPWLISVPSVSRQICYSVVLIFPPQGPVAVKVQVPNMQDKSEWKLSGQVLNFTVPLTDQVGDRRLVTLFTVEGKAWPMCGCNVSTGVCHQSQNPRSYGHARWQTEVAVRGKQFFHACLNVSFNLAMCLTNIFSSLSGHFHQGFQLSGLLQHEQRCSHSLGTEGERRKKEMIYATMKTFT